MKRIFTLCSMVLILQTIFAQPNIPQVIPALQNWEAAKGKYIMPAKGTIFINTRDSSALSHTAQNLADDLKEMFGFQYTVSVSANPHKGSIFLSCSQKNKQMNEEGYKLTIDNKITIIASSFKGVHWGTQTLLQMIHNQPDGLMKGQAFDYPEYPSRGFMIDVGRKFFTMDFLKSYVKILSFYKMNELHIHLNDNGFVQFAENDWNKTYAAFRLESERFPGLTARDGSYSKDEFRELQKMAAQYGIKIIPEIDIPAHSLAFTHYNPRLAADNKNYGADHLDLYKKEVYDFADSLFDEYLSGEDPVFIGPEVHIGTDEYNIKEAEQFRYFTNHYIEFIRKYGKTPRIWGSLNQMKGSTKVDLSQTVISAWNYYWMDLQTALEAGAKVINMCDQFLYIVPGVNYYHDFLDLQWIYEKWSPVMMKTDHKIERHPNFMGAMFAVWNDGVGNGISQQDVHFRCFPAIQVLSDKLWKGENSANTPYSDFTSLCATTPEAPGVNLLAKIDSITTLTNPTEEVSLTGNNTISNGIPEIGYPYAVEFEIFPDPQPCIDAILFKGPHSEFITNWKNTGKLAFRRDGYEMVFHNYSLPKGEWTKIRIEGDIKGTTLYVNGKKQERLEGKVREVYNAKAQRKDKIWYHETLIFPLQQIGDKNMGFKGKVRNLICIPIK